MERKHALQGARTPSKIWNPMITIATNSSKERIQNLQQGRSQLATPW